MTADDAIRITCWLAAIGAGLLLFRLAIDALEALFIGRKG